MAPRRKSRDPGTRVTVVWPGLHLVNPKSRRRKPRDPRYAGVEFAQVRRGKWKSRTAHRRLDPEAFATPRRREGLTTRMKAEAYWRRRDPCAYCGSPSDEWDHMDPYSKGGAHTADNITRSCAPCNAAKRATSVLVFLANQAWNREDRRARNTFGPLTSPPL